MNWRDFPPLASLRAFEAAARTGSYSVAGRALNVSHAAVVQQVRALEAFLDIRLAERSGRGIATTPAGALLSESLTRGFGQIAGALRLLKQSQEDRAIHITMTPSFSVSWFMPRLPQFRATHPEIDLLVNPTVEVVDFARGDVDVAIRFGSGRWGGLDSEPLVASSFAIVGAPNLVAESTVVTADDFPKFPWLQELGAEETDKWLATQGLEFPSPSQITTLPGFMLREALLGGQGISVMTRAVVEDDLAAGRLVLLHEAGDDLGMGYHLVYRRGVHRPALKAFLKWIRQAAR